MAKDDYFVIVYRLLKYLYECLKNGQPVRSEVLRADYFGIDDTYWDYILRNLFLDGYVEGAVLVRALMRDDDGVKILPNFNITRKGKAYLNENPIFQKVRDAVKEISPFIPF